MLKARYKQLSARTDVITKSSFIIRLLRPETQSDVKGLMSERFYLYATETCMSM